MAMPSHPYPYPQHILHPSLLHYYTTTRHTLITTIFALFLPSLLNQLDLPPALFWRVGETRQALSVELNSQLELISTPSQQLLSTIPINTTMSTPSDQSSTSSTPSKPNSRKRREHPLFTANDALSSARQRTTALPATSTPFSSQPTAAPTKGTYAASRPDTVTANGAPTFSTSGSAPVDLFFNGLVRGCDKDKLDQLLTASWQAGPRVTLQLIAHSRDCRNGKGERLVSLNALLYLRTHKRLTYLSNLLLFLRCGYFKDLLVMARMVEEAGGEKLGENELIELEVMAEFLRYDAAQLERAEKRKADREGKEQGNEGKEDENEKDGAEEDVDEYVLIEGLKLSTGDDNGDSTQDEKNEKDKAVGKDEKDEMKEDTKKEEKKDDTPATTRRAPRVSISLAGKWAPTEDSAFDKAPSRFAHRLARLLFPTTPRPLPLYRKLLGRLRAQLQVVERLMAANEWEEIQFDRVPSKAHKLLKKAFGRHQAERYGEYLGAVKRGEKKVNVTGLQPHELTRAYRVGGEKNETTELQWAALVERTKGSAGKLMGAVAVVDVSGSMGGGSRGVKPIDPAIALGLLIANVAQGVFHRNVLTFDDNPGWFALPNDSLHAQVKAVKAAPWGGSTNLQKTFDVILALALKHHVVASAMPRTLFILSDMQFNAACGAFNVSNYEVIQTKYRQAGYVMPAVVFWNLSGGHGSDAPVRYNEAGVAMLSGYSGELLKLIMDGTAAMTPESIMHVAIDQYEVVVEDAER